MKTQSDLVVRYGEPVSPMQFWFVAMVFAGGGLFGVYQGMTNPNPNLSSRDRIFVGGGAALFCMACATAASATAIKQSDLLELYADASPYSSAVTELPSRTKQIENP
ncbi:hypothetical protein GRI38_03480 [Altererythrobacter aurantiacus]|uniref:Uncharacterized protein n=1 Tax=Parapontixanthobacter aurantiacus TaxID=1463599 RepID=A0A844ZDI7_9SPHN|nr:hypothetical protein [Parapontixanthobacter aurantiacus]MXO85087.1 hypothetical protein [Parapontixanthobacter aurantiacus]